MLNEPWNEVIVQRVLWWGEGSDLMTISTVKETIVQS